MHAPEAQSDPPPTDAGSTTGDLVTVRDFIRWGASEFTRQGLAFGHGSETALDDAFHLVLGALRLPFDLPALYFEARLTGAEQAQLANLMQARIQQRLPTAYLLGEAWFAGLPFHVDPRVLIPRSPFAELIEAGFEAWLPRPPERMLDLCTGSGCIGIACALAFPETRVDLADVDAGALQLAGRNVRRHGVADRVHALQGDLFDAVAGERYDLIVTNPPYVPIGEWQNLPPEYRHEPQLALAAGDDGMDLVARILVDAPAFLTADGVLIGEIGGSRAEFETRFVDFPAQWPAFERGGDGIFIIDREALVEWLAQQAEAA